MEAPAWAKWLFGLIIFAIFTACAVWLSGSMVYLLSKTSPIGKTDFLTWWNFWQYYGQDPAYKKLLTMSALIGFGIGYGIPIALIIAANQKIRTLHGEARFARPDEIHKTGLTTEKKGIIVGKINNKYLTFAGQQFVLLAAPTRSGKGVGIVIPNLLNYSDSVVVLDIKQENFDLTAGFRAKYGQKVFLFNPFAEDFRTHRYNPLEYVRDGSFRVGDITAIGKVFFPGEGKDSFFDDSALNVFLGLALYLCETPTLPRTLGEMLRQSSGKGVPVKEYLEGIIKSRNYREIEVEEEGILVKKHVPIENWDGVGLPPLSMECVDSLNRFLNTSDNTLSSILASFNAPLGIWTSPIVDAATSANDFNLNDVRRQKMTIYIGITPDHLHEAGRLINLFFSQLVNLNTKELPQKNPALKFQCLLLMDEFTAIGKVGIIASAVSYIAGYNLRLLPIIQSLSQLASVYGQEDARTFVTNHALQILYAPREQKDANDYSEMLGYETVKGKSSSRQMGDGRGGRSESVSDQRRALLLPQEIKEIGLWKEIISLENTKPILCDKIKYFDDPIFKARLLPPPSVPLLDLDRHSAIVQARIRAATADDVAGGFDLGKLAINTLAVMSAIKEKETMGADEMDAFVDSFLGSLDSFEDEDNAASEISNEDGLNDEDENSIESSTGEGFIFDDSELPDEIEADLFDFSEQ